MLIECIRRVQSGQVFAQFFGRDPDAWLISGESYQVLPLGAVWLAPLPVKKKHSGMSQLVAEDFVQETIGRLLQLRIQPDDSLRGLAAAQCPSHA